MSSVQEMSDDLRFVRDVVQRHAADEKQHSAWQIYWVWAAYVLVGYVLIDHNPTAAAWFFMIGGIAGGLFSWWFAARLARREGEIDRTRGRTDMLHWFGGMVVAYLSTVALAVVIPALRGEAGSQVFVVLIGMVYFFWGVHRERAFRTLGLVLIAGAVCISFIAHYRWTCLGVVISAGLVATSFLHKPRHIAGTSPNAADHAKGV